MACGQRGSVRRCAPRRGRQAPRRGARGPRRPRGAARQRADARPSRGRGRSPSASAPVLGVNALARRRQSITGVVGAGATVAADAGVGAAGHRARSSSTTRRSAPSAPGLCVLVGVTHDDDDPTAARLADKLWNLRVIDDEDGVMNRSVADTGGEVLVVSQFTLYGDTSRGRRPSWIDRRPARARRAARRGAWSTSYGDARRRGRDRALRRRHAGRARQRRPGHAPAGGLSPGRGAGSAGAARRRRAERRPPARRPAQLAPADVPRLAGAAARRVRCTTAASLTAGALRAPRRSGRRTRVKPVGATCTTQRPVSIARSRDDATCWVCTIVPRVATSRWSG